MEENNVIPNSQHGFRYKRSTMSALTEVQKQWTDNSFPMQWAKREDNIKRIGLKTSNKPELITTGNSKIQEQSFANDSAKVWNAAPACFK